MSSGNSQTLPIISPSTLRSEEYQSQISPVWNMLRLLGLLPLKMSYSKSVFGMFTYLIFNTGEFSGFGGVYDGRSNLEGQSYCVE